MKDGLSDDRYIPVLLDLQGMGLEGMDGFLWELARKIVLALRGMAGIKKLDRPKRLEFEDNPRHQFEDVFLPPVLKTLSSHHLLLMFDETDRLTEKVEDGQLPYDVFDYLRSLVQQIDQINFIFSLGRRIELSGKGSSQLLNLAVHRKVSFLDQDYAEDLITRPVAQHYTYTQAGIDRIFKLTAGQPYYTQLLCHNLFTRWTREKPEQLDVPDVEAVIPDVLEQGTSNFEFVWEDSTPAEQAALSALANAGPRYRAGIMRRNLERTLNRAELYPPYGDVTNGLKQLFERDVINDKEPYEFRVELVEIWLNKFKRLDWVVEELGETAVEWKRLEMQRRAEAPTTVEKARRWAAPVLAALLLVLLVVTAYLISNIQQIRRQSSAALNAAEALRVTEAARFNATVSAASTKLAEVQQRPADDSQGSDSLVTAQAIRAAEATAAIALAQLTATAAQGEIATLEAQVRATANLPSATLAPTDTATSIPTTTFTPTPLPPSRTPAPSPTQPPAFAASLQGTIAYPAFNGTTYDIYLGDVASNESRLYRSAASQPAFSADGSRIAFQSWAGTSRGLVTSGRTGGNEYLITNFLEDELPTWSPDGNSIMFFSRRAGDRGSRLYRARADVDFRNNPAREVEVFGEYPSWGSDGQITFKGWADTAPGIRLSGPDFSDIKTVTSSGDQTAPALSPNGTQIAFMGRDEGNWDIYVVNVDGSGLKRLTTDPARDGLPAWSPNGQAIAFVSDREGDNQWTIYGVNANGTVQQKLLDMVGSPDGIVFYDRANSTGWLEERISWSER
jgi:hypothetical protein